VVLRILPESSVAYQALLSGDLDETLIEESVKERAARDPAFAQCCRLVEFYNLDYNYIAVNNRSPFFSDARVRRAVTMLLDRPGIVRGIFRNSARIISGPWAPDSPAYDPAVRPLPFDPGGAARLLAEAGWRDTNGNGTLDRDGKEFEFELLVSAGSNVGRQIDETLAAELAKAGVKATVRPLEWASFVERIDAGNFEAASLAWSASDPNPDPYPYWHSSQFPPKGLNSGYYSNPEADRLMEEARREMREADRIRIFHRLHAIFRDDAPAVFVSNASAKYAFRKDVAGLVTSPIGFTGIWPGPTGWWKTPEGSK
jgi:peptide/nickel transport system substrate-binding protein